MSLESLLSGDTMTVQQATVTKDTSGAPQETYADLYTGVPCRWDRASPRVQNQWMMRGLQIDQVVFTQQAGIGAKHLLIKSDGRKAKVVGVDDMDAIGTMPTYYVLGVSEFRPGA